MRNVFPESLYVNLNSALLLLFQPISNEKLPTENKFQSMVKYPIEVMSLNQ